MHFEPLPSYILPEKQTPNPFLLPFTQQYLLMQQAPTARDISKMVGIMRAILNRLLLFLCKVQSKDNDNSHVPARLKTYGK